MAGPSAFFVPEGHRFVATELTRGPWSNDHQHGGPPAALMGRALQRWGDDAAQFTVVRVTVELLRPVPIGALEVEVVPMRSSRKAQRLTARLMADGVDVARAFGLRVRIAALELPPARVAPHPPFSDPELLPEFVFPFFQSPVGYHTAVDIRIARGEWGRGPAAAWMRLRAPLVAGEEISPLERTLVVADAANGICPALATDQFTFINPDLTVALFRPPVGEWIGLDSRSLVVPAGTGLVTCGLVDAEGEIGHVLQSLVVDRRA
jgi:Thioesterase-like superfamily